MFDYRAYLGWITDIATVPHPMGAWPVTEIDEALLADYDASFAMQQRVGLDISSIWGLAVGRSWALPVEESVTPVRRAQIRRLIESAHAHNVRVLAGTGVYSWGFEGIIAAHPALSGGNPRAMCASNPDAWPWMQRVLDVVGDTLGVDGFSFQSADQGRCPCARCARWGDVAYHARLNDRVAAYVKKRWPHMLVAVNSWGMDLSDPADLPHVVALTRHADYLIDAHSSATRRDAGYRRRLIAAIAPCAYGTVGGPFVEPPQHWERTRWFLPCLDRPARHIADLTADGARAMEVFFHIQANPGDEVSVRHTALLLRDPGRASEDVLHQVLRDLYGPRDDDALEQLAALFRRADAAYFERATGVPESATLSLEPLVSDRAGPPIYLSDHLDAVALAAYERDVRVLLEQCAALTPAVARPDKIVTIATCLQHVLADIARVRTDTIGRAE